MVFSLSVFEGIAESVDTGLQKSFERIRDEIDSTAETQVKREEKAIDAVNKDTQEVMAKLRSAQAVLGGVNDPKSAGRAAASAMTIACELDKFCRFTVLATLLFSSCICCSAVKFMLAMSEIRAAFCTRA